MKTLFTLSPVLIGLLAFGCSPPPRPTHMTAEVPSGPVRNFRPERMSAKVEGQEMPAVRRAVAGRWRFRVTVVGAVEEISVGYFAGYGHPESVSQTGVIAVRLPADAGPGQTWEVEAAFDFDRPVLWEQGLLVWQFAKPEAVIRCG